MTDTESPRSRRGKEGWTGQVSWEQRWDDKRLTVIAQPFLKARTGTVRWAGVAVEAPAQADSLAEILANHSHADVGDFETLAECVEACEEYVDRWLLGRVRQVACACAEIEVSASS
jgi:hypothetical protein